MIWEGGSPSSLLRAHHLPVVLLVTANYRFGKRDLGTLAYLALGYQPFIFIYVLGDEGGDDLLFARDHPLSSILLLYHPQ